MIHSLKTRQGFTLIEMTVVLFIISLLILIIIPNIAHSRNYAMSIHKNALRSVVQTQIDSYLKNSNGDRQVSIHDLEADGYLTNKQGADMNHYHLYITDNKVKR